MRADLTTTYLGLKLRNPLVASAGPTTGDLDSLRALDQAGIAAAILPSLFEEQISHDQQRLHPAHDQGNGAPSGSLSHFPQLRDLNLGPRDYLRLVETAKLAVTIPVIASLNGSTPGGWARYAKLLEDAGADAVELNIYYVPTDPRMTSVEVESRYVDIVATVRAAVRVPLAVKIGAQFTNLTNFVARLASAGADGVVLFNRYLEPDVDLASLRITPQLVLSNRHELRLPLRWIAILRDQTSVSLAATSGIHHWEDVAKLLLVGADACLVTSTLLKHGPDFAAEMIRELANWLDASDYDSVEQIKGSLSYGNAPDCGEIERANYMKAIASYTAAR